MHRYVYVCGPSLGVHICKWIDPSTTFLQSIDALIHRTVAFFLIKVSSPNPRSVCLLNQKWQNAFFFNPKINILCQFCLQQNNDRFLYIPQTLGGLYN